MSKEVTLVQILQAREERVRQQQEMLVKYRCPVISFTMNIAGPIKNNPLIYRGFKEGLRALKKALPEEKIRDCHTENADTGCLSLWAVDMDAAQLKKLCTAIEESTPLGRLFDMDVLDVCGRKLEREGLRGCMVCGAPGRACAAGRVHPVAELQGVTNRILREYFKDTDAKRIAQKAVKALLDEVHTTPKPGLVDDRNSGSHKDMNIGHFVASANALKPYFYRCVAIGQETKVLSPQETFRRLRQAGLDAEKAMYDATAGVNTHKGAIYTLGILCGSIGRLWSAENPAGEVGAITAQSAMMVRESVKADFASAEETAGLQAYRQYGIRGIRGEVAEGLPSVTNIGLPVYRDCLQKGLSRDHAGAVTLLHLISMVEDTNLYRRGGGGGAAWAKKAAQELLKANPYPAVSEVEQLDDSFIARNLSPGGCADLLAVTYFLHSLKLYLEKGEEI